MLLTSGAAWAALGEIIVVNLLLSGDNAVVIALSARRLPPAQQRKAIVWGSVAAVLLRIVLTILAAQLLQIPYLKVAGAAALVWIGVRLLADSEESSTVTVVIGLGAAIRTILFADLVMSIDNVIAVVGAADGAPRGDRVPLLVAGLAMSLPLVILGSAILTRVMARMPSLIALGGALLGYLAGQMLVSDLATQAWFDARLSRPDLVFGAAGAVLVVGLGRWLRRRGSALERS